MAPIVTLHVAEQTGKPGLVIEVDHNAPRSHDDDWRRASGDEVAIIAMTT
jgi:hypothetical protein